MILVTLNIWGGVIYKPLIKFIKDYSNKVDIFCFQEVFSTDSGISQSHNIRSNIYQEIEKVLSNFNGFYAPQIKGRDLTGPVDFNLEMGLAIFAKKSLKINSKGDFFIWRNRFDKIDAREDTPCNIQYLSFQNEGKEFLICNFHGKWFPGSKLDTRQRIRQSHLIKQFLKTKKSPIILCGDFNLMPETRSIVLLEEKMRNLIKDFKIPSTRSKMNLKKYPGKPQYFADYMFVTPDVRVGDFKAVNVEISDHLPLHLEFS